MTIVTHQRAASPWQKDPGKRQSDFSSSQKFNEPPPEQRTIKHSPTLTRCGGQLGITTGAPPRWLDFSPLDLDFLVLGFVFPFVLVSSLAIMATVYQGHVPQGQIPIQGHGQVQQHEQQSKPPISKWWWISFLTTSLIILVIAGALLGVALDVYGNSSTDTVSMLPASYGLFGAGVIFHILFWIFWVIWRRRYKRIQRQNHTIVYLDAAGRPYATTTIPRTYGHVPPVANNPLTQYPVTTKYPAVQQHHHRPHVQTQISRMQPGRYAGAELGTDAPPPTELALQQPSHITTIELAARQRAEMAASPVPDSHYRQVLNTRPLSVDEISKR
jgi:hypothetical protein